MSENKLILGTAQFGLDYGINNKTGKPSQKVVNEILVSAYDNGIRFLDTAEAYGNAHEVIGSFHQCEPEKRFEIISKLPHLIDEDLEVKIQRYLKQLNVNYLAGMLFHSYETYKENAQAIGVLNDFKEQGVLKKIGVSIYTNIQFEDVLNNKLVDIIQLPFNLFDNLRLRGKLLEKAKDLGKIIHTRSCFLQGLFFTDLNNERNIVQALNNELKHLHLISEAYQVPIQTIALSYCIQQKLIDNVLIGVDNLGQLEQNLNDINFKLPLSMVKEINDIQIKNVDLLNPSLWNQAKQF